MLFNNQIKSFKNFNIGLGIIAIFSNENILTLKHT